MRISQALELSGKSMDSFKAGLEELGIKELYELTDNLRFANSPEVFKTTHTFLINKLLRFLEGVEDLESHSKPRGIDLLCYHIFTETGFRIDSNTSPSAGLKKYIDEIISWEK